MEARDQFAIQDSMFTTNSEYSPLIPKNKSPSLAFRFLILFMISIMAMGPYFAYDAVAALADNLLTDRDLSTDYMGLMYSAYSAPNIVLVLFSGLVIDKIGTTKTSIFFSIVYISGSIIFVLSGKSFWGMLVGRAVLGLGSESLMVCRSALLTKWFRDSYINFAFAFASAIAESGASIGFLVLPVISQAYGLNWALWFVVLGCSLCFCVTLLLLALDKKYSPAEELKEEEADIHIKAIKKLPLNYWLVAMMIFFIESSLYSFFAFGSVFLSSTYGYSEVASGRIMSLFGIGQMASPLFGLLLDKISKFRSYVLLFCAAGYSLGCFGFVFTPIHPIALVSWIVLIYAIMEPTLWSSVSVIAEEYTGTAYGITALLYNLGLVILPFAFGEIRDRTGSFSGVLLLTGLMFSCGTLAAMVTVVVTWRHPWKTLLYSEIGHSEEKPSTERDTSLLIDSSYN